MTADENKMDCLLIFDHLNDLIFSKYNQCFGLHIKQLALTQGLISEDIKEDSLNPNIFIQIFSPIISSHRIMHFQFGNSYRTIQFHDDMKIAFYEYMGFLFMTISDGTIKNLVEMYVTLARYLCGPDLYRLQTRENMSVLYSRLMEEWKSLRSSNQAVLVEAIEQLVVNNDITSTCLQTLKGSITKLSTHTECSRIHGLLFVDNKFLSLYSSSNAQQLSPADILFLTILIQCISKQPGEVESFPILISGSDLEPKCIPHIVHIIELFENVFMVYLVETGDPLVSAALYETFSHLHRLRFVQAQRERESIQLGYDNVDLAVRKLNESIKKSKIKVSYKLVMKNWEVLKGKYKEYLKTASNEAILRAETLLNSFLDNLKDLHHLFVATDTNASAIYVENVIPKVAEDLLDFQEYFQVKCIKNFTLGSKDSLTIYKYLEEFSGLIHFLYIDRNTHRVTTPTLDMNADKAEFIRQKIWSMILFAHTHLQKGQNTIIWKDNMFTYGYFLWFEDSRGEALKLVGTPSLGNKVPGILAEDYFMKLKLHLFPKVSPIKIRIYELFVMHLGLTTAQAVLEQTRKLASTIWELKGFPTHAIDLL